MTIESRRNFIKVVMSTGAVVGISGANTTETRAMTEPLSAMKVKELIKEGERYFGQRKFMLARDKYKAARDAFDALSPTDISNLPPPDKRLFYIDLPLMTGDCYHRQGRAYNDAIEQYKTALRAPIYDDTIHGPDVWMRLARTYLTWGDDLYRASKEAEARDKYQEVIKADKQVPNSDLYKYGLGIMKSFVEDFLQNKPEVVTAGGVPNLRVKTNIGSVIMDALRRITQIDAGLNYLGIHQTHVPLVSFDYLHNIARNFAQFAAQANREYIAYRRKAEDDTLTSQQLQQSANLNYQGWVIEKQRQVAAQDDTRAALLASRLAEKRLQIANHTKNTYSVLGSDIVRLDEAQAWAGATAERHDEQIKLKYSGLEGLGIQSRYQPRSLLLQELARVRGQRTYQIELSRLEGNITELGAAKNVAQAQATAAQSRELAAQYAADAAMWRWADSVNNVNTFNNLEINARLYHELADAIRETASIYLNRAIEVAYLMEKAYAFQSGVQISRIRFDYGDIDIADGLYAADFLLRDIDQFTEDRIQNTRAKNQPGAKVISLANEYPLEFSFLRKDGRMRFTTMLIDFERDHPGLYNGRIKQVEVLVEGLVGTTGPVGSLACAGYSMYRNAAGNRLPKYHASETLMISEYRPRRDMLMVDKPTEQLRVFENIGLGSDWLLELPKSRNNFDYNNLTDVKLIVSYDGQHDQELADKDVAELPPNESAKIWYSLKTDFSPDAFYLLAGSGRMDFSIASEILPIHHKSPTIIGLSLIALHNNGAAIPLKRINMWSDLAGNEAQEYTADGKGTVVVQDADPTASGPFRGKGLVTGWHLKVSPDHNPDLRPPANSPDKLDLHNVRDIMMVIQYSYTRP